MQYRIAIASDGNGSGGLIFTSIFNRSVVIRSASILYQLILIGDVAILALGKSPPVEIKWAIRTSSLGFTASSISNISS